MPWTLKSDKKKLNRKIIMLGIIIKILYIFFFCITLVSFHKKYTINTTYYIQMSWKQLEKETKLYEEKKI